MLIQTLLPKLVLVTVSFIRCVIGKLSFVHQLMYKFNHRLHSQGTNHTNIDHQILTTSDLQHYSF